MLDAEIGQHCELSECHQRDFMPFECQYCGDIFCGNHRRPQDHRCIGNVDRDQLYVIICPICEMRIQCPGNDNADTLWQSHSESGKCEMEAKAKAERDRINAANIKRCQAPRCRKQLTVINRNQCARCMMETCMHHRLPEDHNCQQIVTRDPRLAKSKLLQLGKAKPQGAASQAASSTNPTTVAAASQPSASAAMSSASAGLVQTNSEYEQQAKLLAQFQFGGSVPQQPLLGVSLPEVCHVCHARFRDVMDLIAHSEAAHSSSTAQTNAAPQSNSQAQSSQSQAPATQAQGKPEQQRCTECGRAFAITELPTHMQLEHFIF